MQSELEFKEIVELLTEYGYGDLVDLMLLNLDKAFTRNGRLNKCSLARLSGMTIKQIEDKLIMMRIMIGEENE